MSMSNYLEDAIGNALRGGGNGTSFTAPAAIYTKLHTGDPGEDGTANAAGETTRKATTFGASSGGVITSNALVEWTNVSTTETYSHVSLWDASSGGQLPRLPAPSQLQSRSQRGIRSNFRRRKSPTRSPRVRTARVWLGRT